MFKAKVLADRLLLSRRDLHWDQEELSRRSGVSRGYISEIERLRKTNIGVEVVFALAEALGITVPYLLGISDDPLGESGVVVPEQDTDYVTVYLNDPEERRQARKIIGDIFALSPKSRRIAIDMIQSMRQIEEEENAPLVPRIVE